tara:strand:+ start:2362 stop:4023 length:1662 start_codon:yes stop_codon:yes gene_type:complete
MIYLLNFIKNINNVFKIIFNLYTMINNTNGLIESIKMMYLMNIRDMTFIQNIIMSIFVVITSLIINNDTINDRLYSINDEIINFFTIKKYKTIVLTGKRCVMLTNYSCKTDNIFSERFEAFWDYISNNNFKNNSINIIKEYSQPHWSCEDNLAKNNNDDSIDILKYNNPFLVNQTTPFIISPDLYCKVTINKNSMDDKNKIEVEDIKIEIYSYKYSHEYLSTLLDNITIQYKEKIRQARNNKKFIYTLIANKKNNDEYSRNINNWNECEFISSRRFDNLFFEDKKILLNKLNFFINNKEWYYHEGHPWTLGIGLYGPPGTGKTSIIKCIANKLNRHIIVIPLSKIKTQSEFNEYFFEEYYSNKNFKKINFEEKIIVFEDIDCMSDIVKKRKILSDSDNDDPEIVKDNYIDQNLELQNKLLNKIAKKVDEDHNDTCLLNFKKDTNDEITLSYILNIIDGIRETPGRILIITSNNYKSLDPALVRPGRIDITLEMKNASSDIIKEIYTHYYKENLPDHVNKYLKDYILSPAKLVNLRLQNNTKDDFIKALINEFN